MQPSRKYDWVLRPEEVEVVKRFVDQALVPNGARARALAARGDIPIVLYEPMADMRSVFGAGPRDTVVPMTAAQKKRLSDIPDSKGWINKKVGPGETKVFAVIHMGTFLFTWTDGHELYVEPGSLDSEWKS